MLLALFFLKNWWYTHIFVRSWTFRVTNLPSFTVDYCVISLLYYFSCIAIITMKSAVTGKSQDRGEKVWNLDMFEILDYKSPAFSAKWSFPIPILHSTPQFLIMKLLILDCLLVELWKTGFCHHVLKSDFCSSCLKSVNLWLWHSKWINITPTNNSDISPYKSHGTSKGGTWIIMCK